MATSSTMASDGVSLTSKSSYEYATLSEDDSIRLLELLPGTHGPIESKLYSVRLRAEPDFEALSYTWGSPIFPNSLYLKPSNTCLSITDNLYDALKALRLRNMSRILWVDAVCINQANDEEKAHQVGMMKEIYQGARKVIVWLGRGADDPESIEIQRRGFAQLEEIGRHCSSYGFNKETSPVSLHVKDKEALGNLKRLTRECDASLLVLYERAWYERVWVVQEFVLARDLELRCGSLSIDYDLFCKGTIVLHMIKDRVNILRELCYNTKDLGHVLYEPGFDQAWALIQQRERYLGRRDTKFDSSMHGTVYSYEDPILRPSSIIEYCAFASKLKCFNEVDRVYGMLGFAHESQVEISVDYKSAPESIWEMIAQKTLLQGDLTVLHWAGLPEDGNSRVKSFVADFGAMSLKASDMPKLGGSGLPDFHSATSLQPKVELEPDGCIRIHAIKIDTVNQIVPSFDAGTADDNKQEAPLPQDRLAKIYEDMKAKYPHLADETGPRISRDDLTKLYEWWMFWWKTESRRWYSDIEAELAFRRTIIADCALQRTSNMCGWVSMLELDLFFVIYMLAGNGLYVDTIEVFKWMGKAVQLKLAPWMEGMSSQTYYFPTVDWDNAVNQEWHTRAKTEAIELPAILPGRNIIKIPPPLWHKLIHYSLAIHDILADRVMFFTNVRMLGLGPKGMRPGDVIMVPEGAQTPFVYRPVQRPAGCVRKGYLIGECYVYGLMNGDPAQTLQDDYEGSHIEVILI